MPGYQWIAVFLLGLAVITVFNFPLFIGFAALALGFCIAGGACFIADAIIRSRNK